MCFRRSFFDFVVADSEGRDMLEYLLFEIVVISFVPFTLFTVFLQDLANRVDEQVLGVDPTTTNKQCIVPYFYRVAICRIVRTLTLLLYSCIFNLYTFGS